MVEGPRSALLWAAVLVAVTGGLYAYGFVSYESTFTVTWSTEGSNEVAQRTLGPGAEARLTFLVPAQNLTTFAASAAWTDDVGAPDRIVLNVTGPFGPGGATETRQVEGTASPLAVEVAFLAIPATTSVRGDDASDALARLEPQFAPWQGDAEVHVSVWLAEANGEPGTTGGVGATVDDGNDVRVASSYTQYRATLTPSA